MYCMVYLFSMNLYMFSYGQSKADFSRESSLKHHACVAGQVKLCVIMQILNWNIYSLLV